MPETTKEVPKELVKLVDRVLCYHPKPTSKAAKRRERKRKKAATGRDA
jgi:hypothetical protein